MGFEYFVPRTSSWKFALIKSNGIQTVYFLINRLGVDFKFYDYVRDTEIDNNSKLYTDGGLIVRNYYFGSDINVHHLILRVANQLANDIPIDNTLLTGQGWSINKQRASSQALVDESWMQEIWEWADKYKLPEDTIPRNRADLLALDKIRINDDIRFLPENIGKLSNLKSLYMCKTLLTTLPNSIGDLSSLESLNVSYSKLDSLPDSIVNLKNLQYLKASNNKFDSLPEIIGSLSNLEVLYIADNDLKSLPEIIGSLSNLEVLNIAYNDLKSLPESIRNLNNLKSLDVSYNSFVSPPEIIGSLSSLELLIFHGNKAVPNTVDFEKVKFELDFFSIPQILRDFPNSM